MPTASRRDTVGAEEGGASATRGLPDEKARASRCARAILRPAAAAAAALALAVALAAGPRAEAAPASVRYVASAGEFELAVSHLAATGGTIVLLPHRYTATLVVGPRGTRPLRIVGSRRSPVRSLLLD